MDQILTNYFSDIFIDAKSTYAKKQKQGKGDMKEFSINFIKSNIPSAFVTKTLQNYEFLTEIQKKIPDTQESFNENPLINYLLGTHLVKSLTDNQIFKHLSIVANEELKQKLSEKMRTDFLKKYYDKINEFSLNEEQNTLTDDEKALKDSIAQFRFFNYQPNEPKGLPQNEQTIVDNFRDNFLSGLTRKNLLRILKNEFKKEDETFQKSYKVILTILQSEEKHAAVDLRKTIRRMKDEDFQRISEKLEYNNMKYRSNLYLNEILKTMKNIQNPFPEKNKTILLNILNGNTIWDKDNKGWHPETKVSARARFERFITEFSNNLNEEPGITKKELMSILEGNHNWRGTTEGEFQNQILQRDDKIKEDSL